MVPLFIQFLLDFILCSNTFQSSAVEHSHNASTSTCIIFYNFCFISKFSLSSLFKSSFQYQFPDFRIENYFLIKKFNFVAHMKALFYLLNPIFFYLNKIFIIQKPLKAILAKKRWNYVKRCLQEWHSSFSLDWMIEIINWNR